MVMPFSCATDVSTSPCRRLQADTDAKSLPAASPTPYCVVLMMDDLDLAGQIATCVSTSSICCRAVRDASSRLLSRSEHQAVCTIADLDRRDISAADVKQILSERDASPMIVIGSEIDAREAVRTIKAGAFDLFAKPLDVSALIASVHAALSMDIRARQRRTDQHALRNRYSLLTAREREVLPLVVGGLLNKQAASLLGISEITLQIHRGQVMRKMQATSLADLVRIAMRLKLPYWGCSKRHEAAFDALQADKGHEGSAAYSPSRSSSTPVFVSGTY